MTAEPPALLAGTDVYPAWAGLVEPSGAIDPFDYRQRLAVLKLLMDATNAGGIFGADNALNLFWGYVFQYQWQWSSGRLQLGHTTGERVDPDSAWGFANHSLSVIPLIAAMQSGLAPKREIAPPPTPAIYPYAGGDTERTAGAFQVPALFAEAVTGWRAFFALLRRTEPGDLEPLRFQLWRAHLGSLTVVEAVIHDRGAPEMSRNELDFLIGWIRMVDFLGTAAWRTDLPYVLEQGLDVLPERRLTDTDVPGRIPDMSARVNRNVRNVLELTRQSRRRFALNLWLWKRAMRTREARHDVLRMLDATFNPSPENLRDRRRLLRYIVAW